jgi:hypothetical protein
MNAYRGSPPNTPGGAPSSGFGIVNILFILVALLALYYLYRFLFRTEGTEVVILVPGQTAANATVTIPSGTKFPIPYEGGEYTFTTWVYVSSYKTNLRKRKHIFEIAGPNFSTLLVGLGAHSNSLMVRTQSRGAGETAPAGTVATASACPTSGSEDAGQLSKRDVECLFNSIPTEATETGTPTLCDLPEVDMQRWVMVSVVLSGKTIDVYMDGKLARSCVSHSYFKVDSSVNPKILDKGGFDGYVSNLAVANYAMNPDEIYRLYSAGPKGASMDPIGWIKNLFQGSGGS